MKWWYLSTLTSFGNDKQHNNAWLQKDISFSKRKIDIRLIPQSHRFDRTDRLELDSALAFKPISFWMLPALKEHAVHE